MYNDKIKKGSQWLKWDCHLHTPISYQNQFNSFDDYIDALKVNAIKHSTDVVIINDYFTIDGYKELIKNCEKDETYNSYYLNIGEDKKLYILPGIELRIDNFTMEEHSVNMHIFFNQNITPELIESDFLSKLNINYKNTIELSCTKDTLIKVGFSKENSSEYNHNLNISEISDVDKERYISSALSVISVTTQSVKDAFQKFQATLRNDSYLASNCMLIAMAYSGHGSLGEINWEEGRATNVKHQLLGFADICITSNEKDINFLLGKHKSTPKEEIEKLFGNLKPCVWGSDAHKNENICHPSNGDTYKYTWIKGMPNFDGLKQIIFEPKNRVKVQELNPRNKSDYMIIDKVKFKNNSDDDIFIEDDILFNEDLNTIIGGKSSGKSLLLSHIARTVNGETEKFERYEKLSEKYNYDFEVHWKDGKVSKLSDKNKTLSRKVKYISQLYVNRLAEGENQEIKNIVIGILKENKDIEEEYSTFDKKLNSIDADIKKLVLELKNIVDEMNKVKSKILDIGDLEGIIKEISKLEEDVSRLLEESKLSEEDLQKYETINKTIDENKLSIDEINNIILPEIESYTKYFEFTKSNLKNDIANKVNMTKSRLKDKYDEVFESTLNDVNEIILTLDEKIDSLNKRYSSFVKNKEIKEAKNKELLNEIKRYELKIKNQVEIERLNKNIKQEKEKKSKIENLDIEIKIMQDEYNNKINKILECIDIREESYRKILEKLENDDYKFISEDKSLVLNYTLKIKDEDIKSEIEDILIKSNKETKEILNTSIDLNNYKDFVISLIKESLNNSSKFGYKKNKGTMDLIYSLLDNYLDYNLSITENDDEFEIMSPGKQGLILLKILVHLSNEKYPILIDQPEDNLDNRTITSELKEFIVEKKSERQIIMVTHNANLSVLSDSDEVIVANQSGKVHSKENKKYKFEYVTGPLEYSFTNKEESGVLQSKGIKEHVCEILEGGREAFKQRENKYGF